MNWTSLLQTNFGTILAVIGTLLGALIGTFVTKLLELRTRKSEWEHEYRQRVLIDPVVSFIDEELFLMSRIYWTAMDGKEPAILDRLIEHREKDGTFNARITAFNDEQLTKAYSDLSYRYALFRNAIGDKKINKAFELMKEAQQIAGKIFARIGIERFQ